MSEGIVEFSDATPADTRLVNEAATDSPEEPRAALYALRMLGSVNAWEKLGGAMRTDPELRLALGFECPPADSKDGAEMLRKSVMARLDRLERTHFPETPFSRNLSKLAERIGLPRLDAELLGVLALLHGIDWFHDVAERAIGGCSCERAVRYLAWAIGAPVPEVRRCLVPADAWLARTGLLMGHSRDMQGREELTDRFTLAFGLPAALIHSENSPFEFFAWRCRQSPPARRAARDFDHLADEFELMTRLVLSAVRAGTAGVNVLIHGPPGTGKTELVRALVEAAKLDLWEVGTLCEAGGSAAGRERMGLLRMAQALLARNSRAVLLFDEFEDALKPGEGGGGYSPPSMTKSYLNGIVETNRVPTFWVSNCPRWLEDATLRRFTHVLEMPEPSRAVNERILAAELGAFGLSAGWAARVGADERLVPAYAERARRVLEHVAPPDADAAERMAERVLTGCVSRTGRGGPLRKEASTPSGYRLGFLNTNYSVQTLADGVRRTGQGRFCLAGPPGTGKTAFARYLARRLGRHLLIRRSSDLLGPFVGMTEQLIAAAFAKAERDEAVLLIDEVEGLLQSRAGARQRWEVTQVNEMLTQLEAFHGVFFATTNLAETFDVAVQRRFDALVKFGYLRPARALVLLRAMIEQASGERPALSAAQRLRLAAVPNLTPGDFAAIGRRAHLFGREADVDWWIGALTHDAAAKPDAPKAPPGFLAAVS